MEKFIARYTTEKGIQKSFSFDKSRYNKEQAEEALKSKGIQNFFFFFEPSEPVPFGENGVHFQGDIGFDITMNNLLPYVEQGKDIYLDSFGGDLFEGWKIHDAIKETGKNPKIVGLGTVASSAVQILLSTPNRELTPQSRMLIHNPWAYEMGDDEQMQRMANKLRGEKQRLAEFYAGISGKPIDEILALMKEERFMYSDEAANYNFINNNNENEEVMNEEQKEQLNSISKAFNTLKNIFIKPEIQNIVIQDVNGVEIDFGETVETMEQISVGSNATIDGAPANGEYVLQDGTVYVFESGELMEIKEPEAGEDEDVEALKAENESLKEQIADMENKVSEKEQLVNKLQDERVKLESDFTKVSKDFENFKNQFSDEKQDMNTPGEEQKEKKKFSYKRN